MEIPYDKPLMKTIYSGNSARNCPPSANVSNVNRAIQKLKFLKLQGKKIMEATDKFFFLKESIILPSLI